MVYFSKLKIVHRIIIAFVTFDIYVNKKICQKSSLILFTRIIRGYNDLIILHHSMNVFKNNGNDSTIFQHRNIPSKRILVTWSIPEESIMALTNEVSNLILNK